MQRKVLERCRNYRTGTMHRMRLRAVEAARLVDAGYAVSADVRHTGIICSIDSINFVYLILMIWEVLGVRAIHHCVVN